MRRSLVATVLALAIGACGCSTLNSPAPLPSITATPGPSAGLPTPSARTTHRSNEVVSRGTPIDRASLSGRIVFDDFEDLWAMNVDGSGVVQLAASPKGPEFDGTWSPDGS